MHPPAPASRSRRTDGSGFAFRIGARARLDTAHLYVRNPKANTLLYRAYKGTEVLDRRDTNPSGQVHVLYGLND